MELEDWLFNELNALDREDLVELIYKFAADCSSLEELADYVDGGDWKSSKDWDYRD